MPSKLTVTLKSGATEAVDCFAKFDYAIDGRTFRFAVTQDVQTPHKNVTHIASGLKVCVLGVGATYLPAYARLNNDRSRAEAALGQLISRHGSGRVRDVIEAAESPKPAVTTSAPAPRDKKTPRSFQYIIKDAQGKPLQSRDRFQNYTAVAREVMSVGARLPLTVWAHNTITGMESYDGPRTRKLSDGVRMAQSIA